MSFLWICQNEMISSCHFIWFLPNEIKRWMPNEPIFSFHVSSHLLRSVQTNFLVGYSSSDDCFLIPCFTRSLRAKKKGVPSTWCIQWGVGLNHSRNSYACSPHLAVPHVLPRNQQGGTDKDKLWYDEIGGWRESTSELPDLGFCVIRNFGPLWFKGF
jgi:hypothetical protein